MEGVGELLEVVKSKEVLSVATTGWRKMAGYGCQVGRKREPEWSGLERKARSIGPERNALWSLGPWRRSDWSSQKWRVRGKWRCGGGSKVATPLRRLGEGIPICIIFHSSY